MKTQRKPQRSINSVSTTRWTAYMAAAAASTFAGVGSAEAEIHYSGDVSIELTGNAHASLPLSNGASLVFENRARTTFWQDFNLLMTGVISGSAREYGHFFFDRASLSNLPARENVSAGKFGPVDGPPYFGALISNWSDGAFAPNGGPNRGFVGFRFNTGNGRQYGWARIEARNVSNRLHEVIKDYAWADVGESILTGQKHPLQADAKSLPGSLGLLAFGAQGLDAWRTQRMPKSN